MDDRIPVGYYCANYNDEENDKHWQPVYSNEQILNYDQDQVLYYSDIEQTITALKERHPDLEPGYSYIHKNGAWIRQNVEPTLTIKNNSPAEKEHATQIAKKYGKIRLNNLTHTNMYNDTPNTPDCYVENDYLIYDPKTATRRLKDRQRRQQKQTQKQTNAPLTANELEQCLNKLKNYDIKYSNILDTKVENHSLKEYCRKYVLLYDLYKKCYGSRAINNSESVQELIAKWQRNPKENIKKLTKIGGAALDLIELIQGNTRNTPKTQKGDSKRVPEGSTKHQHPTSI